MTKVSVRDIRNWMRRNVHGFIECGEVQCTQLAEACADALDCDERLDDPDDAIWDIAVQVAEEFENLSEEE